MERHFSEDVARIGLNYFERVKPDVAVQVLRLREAHAMSDFTDQCIPQDDAAYWYRVQLQECDGCRGGHFELQRHKDGRWLCG